MIYNRENRKKYIGQSVDVKRRIRDHKRLLTRGKHKNEYLQNEFNKYGSDVFVFEIIETCNVCDLDERERFYISGLKTNKRSNGFNLDDGGNVGKVVSEETRKKFSGRNNPMYGRKHNDQFIKFIKLKNRGNSNLLNEKDVEDIKIKLANGSHQIELAKKYGVTKSTINKIAMCKNWEWVKSDLNDKLLHKNLERDKSVKSSLKDLKSPNKVAKALGIDVKTVERITGTTTKQMLEERNRKIVDDFKKGMSKQEIIEKHSITPKIFKTVTAEAAREKKKALMKQAIEMRSNGMTVASISKELGIHRTTVTEWTKHLL